MTGLPPELVGTSWDTPDGRAKYARIAADPPTSAELVTPEPWRDRACELLHPFGPLARPSAEALEAEGRIAAALADAYTAGRCAGELNS